MVINHRQAPSRVSYLRCPNRYLSKTCTGGHTYQYQRLEQIVLDQVDGLLFAPTDFPVSQNSIAEELAQAKTKRESLKRRIDNLEAEGEEKGFSHLRGRLVMRRSGLEGVENQIKELEGEYTLERQTFSTADYVEQIKAKRIEAKSDDLDPTSAPFRIQ